MSSSILAWAPNPSAFSLEWTNFLGTSQVSPLADAMPLSPWLKKRNMKVSGRAQNSGLLKASLTAASLLRTTDSSVPQRKLKTSPNLSARLEKDSPRWKTSRKGR